MRQNLLEESCIFLLKEGYTVKSLKQACFDILARKEDKILLIKVLEDANAIAKDNSNEMKKVSSYLRASPLIVAEKAGDTLMDNVVYSRFGLYCLNLETLKASVQQNLPFVYRDHSGLTAILRGKTFREVRERQGYSLPELSKRIGVSRRMIVKYETQKSKVTLQKALKMHRLLGDQIFDKINPFNREQEGIKELRTDIGRQFENLGFDATETRKVPFDVIAKKENDIILTEVGDKTDPNLKPLSRLLDAENLVIYKKKKPKNIPSLTKKEFLDFQKSYELIKFLKEY